MKILLTGETGYIALKSFPGLSGYWLDAIREAFEKAELNQVPSSWETWRNRAQ